MSEVLVHVTRGNYIESRHHGDLAVVDRDGKLLYAVGDPDRFTFWRSAAKPFQAAPFVEAGGIEHFQIEPHELALMTSSHGGEAKHVAALRSILHKIGCTEEQLDCGIAPPMHSKAAAEVLRGGDRYEVVHNPCSGKHAAMLALGKLLHLPMENYLHPHHPIQQIMLDTVAQCCHMKPKDIAVAIDGCGVPVFGMNISKMALAYARFSKPEGYFSQKRITALRTILAAMTNNPFYVAGTDRLDTALMEVTRGRIVAKLGAEAVYSVGIVDQGIGICLKIDDGAYRAIGPVIIEVLKRLDLITGEELKKLEDYWKPKLKNHRQEIIGELQPVFTLQCQSS